MEYKGHRNDSDETLILVTELEIEATTEEVLQGGCIGSGALLTVFRLHQANAYYCEFGR